MDKYKKFDDDQQGLKPKKKISDNYANQLIRKTDTSLDLGMGTATDYSPKKKRKSTPRAAYTKNITKIGNN